MAAPRIFVSHSHHDNAFCRDYINGLRERGLEVWYDEHSLGWGALRATIEREMPLCQHFVAILSPSAVASEWVNAEIDAALELLKDGTLQTLTFVIAAPCNVPLLLRRWKRIEGMDGTFISVAEAVARTARIVTPPSTIASNQASLHAASTAQEPYHMPRDRFPERLEQLGFVAKQTNGVEYILPPLCDIPTGSFLMGSDMQRDLQAFDDELPQHPVTLPSYQIARFPVTVAEYACFVRVGHAEPASPYNKLSWQTQLTQRHDHPVVNVSWHDTLAYTTWLVKHTKQPWRLPNEAEWEKAARNSDSRIYPWGDAWDQTCANTREGGKNITTSIGNYLSGVSPYGVHDLAGNVFEWTDSLFKPYPYTSTDGRENQHSFDKRVLRGGSWNSHSRGVRAAYRLSNRPSLLVNLYGFRLCIVAPIA